MKRIKLFIVSLIFAASPAFAVSTGTDFSDMWWNASESGWGVNITHQENIIFASMFIYGAANTPTWLTASLTFTSTNAAGDSTFTGKLYTGTGTAYTTLPFFPAGTTTTEIGTATFVGLASGTGILTYTTGGVTYTKNISRFTFTQPSVAITTTYRGSSSYVATGYPIASDNGTFNGDLPQVAISISGSQMRLELKPNNTVTCTATGTNYVQEGRYGKATLTGQCTGDPTIFTLTAREVQVSATSISMRYRTTSNANAGVETGTIVGAKK